MMYRAIWLLPALSTAPSISAEVSAESLLRGCEHHLQMLGVKPRVHRGNFRTSAIPDAVITLCSMFSHISYHYNAPKLHLLQTYLVGSDL